MKEIVSRIINDHLLQYAHPIVDAKSLSVEFYEILSRVGYGGNIEGPKEFMSEITPHQRYTMAKCILEKIKSYQKEHLSLSFSVNISSLEFEQGILQFLNELGIDKQIDPSRCIIEVSESMNTSNLVIEQMVDLKNKYGFRFALDDFGAGFSNFEQIFRSNGLYEFIKIDGSMVTGIQHDEAKKSTLGAFIQAIRFNNKKSIVEFVEDEEILKIVLELGADFLQGYVFGKPAPIEDFLGETKSFIAST